MVPSERALAARWGISRPIIREGIGMLVARGILVRRHGRGTFVNETDEQVSAEVWAHLVRDDPNLQRDVLEFRHALERHAAQLAAECHDATDRERLRDAEAEVHRAFCGSDPERQMHADLAFHHTIADATHNLLHSSLTQSMHRMLYEHMQLSFCGHEGDDELKQQVRAQHRALLDAILSRDAEAAGISAAAHIDFVRIRLNYLDAPR
jgi:DNA-binding FadR family transcriptional regulator